MKTAIRIGLALSIAPIAAQASVHDHLFAGSFEVPVDAPANANEAARFLTQATFGPTPADIARLMALGYGEWIDEQLGMQATLGEPTVESVTNARTLGGQTVGNTQRLNRWFWQATYAPDQLRQRMAYALSQVFVVSDQASAIGGRYAVPLTQYQDMLALDAFVLYRQLLGDVTWHPMMGRYLNAYHNLKPSASTSPDENYAREVMQLFSVGLILRNQDFSPALSGGLTVPTYDQTVITHTAKVFTGFTWNDAPRGSGPPAYAGANFFGGGLNFAAQYAPMACWGTELFPASGTGSNNMRHDITGDDGTTSTSKSVLGAQTVPANQTCAQDVGDELDIIAAHHNVAPFISRQLIQRFVTSNPSPAYIQRITTVFDNTTGDLGDVIKAILLDSEARIPPPLVSGDSYGKLREPILRLTAMWRAFHALAPVADGYGEIKMVGPSSLRNALAQAPLQSPTVFNFYLPDFQQPGTFADNDLYSPEFQITNESTTYTAANVYYNFTEGAYLGMASPPADRPLVDLSSLTVDAANPSAMVATLNASMLYGSMSAAMQTSLTNMITFLSGASPQEKAWSAIYVTLLSPEYATQR